ncbi:hypothetical protein HMPREF1544_03051 [Mucor circinelloides 1006PhL]|uniref:Uncharacterized protein n=1 Tax=Mucor circinelloides f. circinelloides (strain 1006PhL) TaxID=1220926 RepID=S2KCP5_MUCC1|nr:hypothetical protein HMPREF1544_03051 [Mucor circinelloides 1006PhL]
MYSKLVEDTTKKNIIEEVKVFTPSEHGELWQCPFCDPSKTVYKLAVPPAKETERLYYIKKMIREHVELHQRDLLSKMDYKDYDKSRAESIKRVRLWITGTIADRKLYEENPLHE